METTLAVRPIPERVAALYAPGEITRHWWEGDHLVLLLSSGTEVELIPCEVDPLDLIVRDYLERKARLAPTGP